MGIINVTRDSFFAPSRSPDPGSAVEAAHRMVEEGADILDLGAESSRPGSEYVSEKEELARLVPVVAAVNRALPLVPISVDTRKSRVARAALDEGATIVNDISACRDDAAMAPLIAERGVHVVLMHMRGVPTTMQENPTYRDVVSEVIQFLGERARAVAGAGVDPKRIVVDPGIGFGKRFEDNWSLLRNLGPIADLGYEVLVGLSRKSFLGGDQGPSGRLSATIAAQLWCTIHDVGIIRVHDVQAMRDALRVWEELNRPASE